MGDGRPVERERDRLLRRRIGFVLLSVFVDHGMETIWCSPGCAQLSVFFRNDNAFCAPAVEIV
jgi:hypothetical protein